MFNKKTLILSILVLISGNFLLAYIPWIPSFTVYIYFVTFIVYILIVVLGYKLIKSLCLVVSDKDSERTTIGLSIIGSILLLGVLGANIFMQSELVKGIHLSTKVFDDQTFYLYETGFVDSIVELRIKHDYLPILSNTLFIINNHGKISLEREGNIIYLIHTSNKSKEIEKLKIYDLNLKKDFSSDYALL